MNHLKIHLSFCLLFICTLSSFAQTDTLAGIGDTCVPNLVITTNVTTPVPAVDLQQASATITATNTISNGSQAIYHAGTTVILQNGFTAQSGSVFRAYIADCTNSFTALKTNNARNGVAYSNPLSTADMGLKAEQAITMTPNPNDGVFTIHLHKEAINTLVALYDITGRKVAEKSFTNEGELKMDIRDRPSGVYMIRVYAGEEMFNEKLIKK